MIRELVRMIWASGVRMIRVGVRMIRLCWSSRGRAGCPGPGPDVRDLVRTSGRVRMIRASVRMTHLQDDVSGVAGHIIRIVRAGVRIIQDEAGSSGRWSGSSKLLLT